MHLKRSGWHCASPEQADAPVPLGGKQLLS